MSAADSWFNNPARSWSSTMVSPKTIPYDRSQKDVKGQFNTWIKINEKYNEEVIYNFAVLLLHFDVGNLQQKQWE